MRYDALAALFISGCSVHAPEQAEVRSESQRGSDILANDPVIFSHSHLWDHSHLEKAQQGGLTAMTVDLIVDTMEWRLAPLHCSHTTTTSCGRDTDCPTGETCGTLVTTCCNGQQVETPTETFARPRFDAAFDDPTYGLTHELSVVSQDGYHAVLIDTVDDIDSARSLHELGVIVGAEGSLVTKNSATGSLSCTLADTGTVPSRLQPQVDDLFLNRHWRQGLLVHNSDTDFVSGGIVTCAGQVLTTILNRRGVALDVTHLNTNMLNTVLPLANAPVYASHLWAPGNIKTLATSDLQRIAATGGGHGVIGLNALGADYGAQSCAVNADCNFRDVNNQLHTGTCSQSACACTPDSSTSTQCASGLCQNSQCQTEHAPAGCAAYSHPINGVATLANYIERLDCLVTQVGIDHVAIGPDFMPEPNNYSIGGHTFNAPPNLDGDVVALVEALISHQRPDGSYFSDLDIGKMIGGNLHDFYQRVWDPTHNGDGGDAHLRLCTNASTDATCNLAAQNRGQGSLRQRAINCARAVGYQPMGLQLFYNGTPPNGVWQYYDINGQAVNCANGSTLVVSWGANESNNARIAIHGTGACDAACTLASSNAGAGTWNSPSNNKARALSCGNPSSSGIVGLRLDYSDPDDIHMPVWHFYNIANQLANCSASSTLVATWDTTGLSNMKTRLCDDRSGESTAPAGACKDATLNGGTGTAAAKALNCLSSSQTFGTVALQVAYVQDPISKVSRWFYYDLAGQAHRCVHGSVLVATTEAN